MTSTALLERTTSEDHTSVPRPATGDDGRSRRQAVSEALARSGSAPSIRELPRFRGE